jgi:hypothetical protein
MSFTKSCFSRMKYRSIYLILAMLASNFSVADTGGFPTYITVLPNQTLLTYPQSVRLSQVLSDAYTQADYPVYSLGTTLVDPHKQPMVEVQKQKVLRQLMLLNTPETLNLAKQINSMRFAYYQEIESDPNKVQAFAKRNPLLNQEFWLYLPDRPSHIKVVSPQHSETAVLDIQYNAELRDYLATFADAEKEDQPYDSLWIIQADRKVHPVSDLTWSDKLYFLSPGALVFTGLKDLPYEFRDLNGDIAQLLSHRLEL